MTLFSKLLSHSSGCPCTKCMRKQFEEERQNAFVHARMMQVACDADAAAKDPRVQQLRGAIEIEPARV